MILDKTKYVDTAEAKIKKLREKSTRINQRTGREETTWITTSKLRNILAMSADIYNEVLTKEEKLDNDVKSRIEYFRVRCVYECGKDSTGQVKNFVEQTQLIDALKEVNGSRERFITFNHYLEALVAFHKFYGGKE